MPEFENLNPVPNEDNLTEQSLPLDTLKEMVTKGVEDAVEGETGDQADSSVEVKEEGKKEEPVPVGATEKTEENQSEEKELILGKFKSPDDAYKAYQELEKKSTQDSQRVSKYKEFMSPYVDFDLDGNVVGLKPEYSQPTGTQPSATGQQPAGETVNPLDTWEQRYNELEAQYGGVKANLIVQAEMAQRMIERTREPIDKISADNSVAKQKAAIKDRPDYAFLEPEIDVYLSRMDTKSKLNPKAVDTVYNIVRGRNLDKLVEQKIKEAQLKNAEIEKQKEDAQVEHTSKTPEEPLIDVDTATSDQLAKHLKLGRVERY